MRVHGLVVSLLCYYLTICMVSGGNVSQTALYSRGVFSTEGTSKTHVNDVYHLKELRPLEYFSFLLGHSRTWLGLISNDIDSAIVLERLSVPNVDKHCEELLGMAPAWIVFEVDDLPSISNAWNDEKRIGAMMLVKDPLELDLILIATKFSQRIISTKEGVASSVVEVRRWEPCAIFFNSNRSVEIETTVFEGKSVQYENRWDIVYEIYDFTIQERAFLFIYLILGCGTILSAGTWMLLVKLLRRDCDIMISDAVRRDMGASRQTVAWKRIEKDVFRVPLYSGLYIAIIANGTFLVVVVVLGIIASLLTPLIDRTPLHDLYIFSVLLILSSVAQGVAMSSLRIELMPVGKELREWQRRHICVKALRRFLLSLPLSLSILTGSSMYYTKWHIMQYEDTLYSYGTRVVLPTIALLGSSTLAIVTGSLFPLTLSKRQKTRSVERMDLLGEFGGSIIPKASRTYSNKRMMFSIICPILVTIPPFWVHFKILTGSIWIGIIEKKLLGFSIATFVTSWLAFATCNIGSCYLMLQRGDYNWWWPVISTNGITAFATIVFFLFSTSLPKILMFDLVLIGSFVLFLTTIGFYSQYAFIRYIYFSLKAD